LSSWHSKTGVRGGKEERILDLIQGRIEEFVQVTGVQAMWGPSVRTMRAVVTPMRGSAGVLPRKILKSRCSEMRFQANPDDIKSLVNEVNLPLTQILGRAIIIGKNKKIKD
jgi:hypothetical protein